jgi:hypothetical protein
MKELTATVSIEDPSSWALLQRSLINRLNSVHDLIVDGYVRDDGRLMWPPGDEYTGVDGLDDAYESFQNWPLFYLLGGDERFLETAKVEWEAITEQFARYDSGHGHPMVVDEYEQGRDWFHQSEGNLLLYHIRIADPDDEAFADRARRFADLYRPDAGAGNFDMDEMMVTAPETGSMGPVLNLDGEWSYAAWKEIYGLPFQDVKGVDTLADLDSSAAAQAMGEAMAERMGEGDIPMNLAITSLATVAYLLTGEDAYARWVREYVDAWRDRTRENGGIVPDNVGPSGDIGACLDGKWYGGYYGWTWPHGWLSFGDAVVAGAQNAHLLGANASILSFPRSQLDVLIDAGIEYDGTLYVPYKHGDEGWYGYEPTTPDVLYDDQDEVRWLDGWFEFQPMGTAWPAHLWHASRSAADRDRLRRVRQSGPDELESARENEKDNGGHEGSWVAYATGEFPEYPERILRHNHRQVSRRIEYIRRDEQDPATYDDDYLQHRNPVTVEGLVQLTMGGPLPLYNGGLLQTSVRHFDPERGRPGLPENVAALVSSLSADGLTLTVSNVGGRERTVVVQAGTYGEHQFRTATYDASTQRGRTRRVVDVDDAAVRVRLEPSARTRIEFEFDRYVNDPAAAFPL